MTEGLMSLNGDWMDVVAWTVHFSGVEAGSKSIKVMAASKLGDPTT